MLAEPLVAAQPAASSVKSSVALNDSDAPPFSLLKLLKPSEENDPLPLYAIRCAGGPLGLVVARSAQGPGAIGDGSQDRVGVGHVVVGLVGERAGDGGLADKVPVVAVRPAVPVGRPVTAGPDARGAQLPVAFACFPGSVLGQPHPQVPSDRILRLILKFGLQTLEVIDKTLLRILGSPSVTTAHIPPSQFTQSFLVQINKIPIARTEHNA